VISQPGDTADVGDEGAVPVEDRAWVVELGVVGLGVVGLGPCAVGAWSVPEVIVGAAADAVVVDGSVGRLSAASRGELDDERSSVRHATRPTPAAVTATAPATPAATRRLGRRRPRVATTPL
jgi:hypothetical protein